MQKAIRVIPGWILYNKLEKEPACGYDNGEYRPIIYTSEEWAHEAYEMLELPDAIGKGKSSHLEVRRVELRILA